MKRAMLMGVSAMLVLPGLAGAEESKPVFQESKPVVLSAEQMDSITAGEGLPYGKIIIDATGRSFGGLIGPAKKAGTSAHGNYAGGAKALVEAVLAGQHPIPPN